MNEEFAKSLGTIVGFDWVDVGADIGLPIIDGVMPSIRVCPATAEEVASILHLCAQNGVAVIPTGAGSALGLGNIPRKADILLSTRRLNKIIQYNSADMTVSTQAGVGLAELQEVLGRDRQFLPIDPPWSSWPRVGPTGPRTCRIRVPPPLHAAPKCTPARRLNSRSWRWRSPPCPCPHRP